VCVGDELTDDSASTLQRSKSKRSTFPGGAPLAQKPKAWSGILRLADARWRGRGGPGRCSGCLYVGSMG
jgi:hypothetical protein